MTLAVLRIAGENWRSYELPSLDSREGIAAITITAS